MGWALEDQRPKFSLPVLSSKPRRRRSPLPKTWGDCGPFDSEDFEPCPMVSCRHNLFLDVNEITGRIKFNFPGKEIEDIPETCSLRVAERGGTVLESIADLMNLTREAVRHIENKALQHLSENGINIEPPDALLWTDSEGARELLRCTAHQLMVTVQDGRVKKRLDHNGQFRYSRTDIDRELLRRAERGEK